MPESKIAEKIITENEFNKRVNGHSAEYIAQHIGESVEELFPPDKKCLYIGDLWQKLDAQGVTIIDYEYGSVVEYRATKEELNNRLRGQYLRSYSDQNWEERHRRESVTEGTPEAFLVKQRPKIELLIAKMENAQLYDYPAIAKEFQLLREEVEKEVGSYGFETDGRELSAEEDRVVSLWYLATEGARIQDVFDQKTYLGPELEKYAKTLDKSLSKEERRKLIWQKRRELVEGIRLEKTTKEADVVQSIFPELPFANDSFDRLVAYYSISTHVFPALEYDDFMMYWSEIDRVLKDWGKAYIGPLYNTGDNVYWDSINKYQAEHPDFCFIEEERPDIPPASGMMRLVIYKIGDYEEEV